jgi:hypothetical protein
MYTQPVQSLHVYIRALPLDNPRTYIGCCSVSSMPEFRKYLKKKKRGNHPLPYLKGFLDLVLVFVVAVCSLSITSD